MLHDEAREHSGGAVTGNLPVELTSLVGRRDELAQVKRLLAGSRLVTLTGSAGPARPGWRCGWPRSCGGRFAMGCGGRGLEIWHGPPFPPEARQPGVDPQRTSYGSFFAFTDPDGNAWLVQEVTKRHPGRIDPTRTSFGSTADLASALRRAEAAHREHEQRRQHRFMTGRGDDGIPG
jgi:hypothetical protein